MKKIIFLISFLLSIESIHTQNQALDFDGVDDQMITNVPISGNVDFTLEIWFKIDNIVNFTNLFTFSDPSGTIGTRFQATTIFGQLVIIDDFANSSSLINPQYGDLSNNQKLTITKNGDLIKIFSYGQELIAYTTGQMNEFNLESLLTFGYRNEIASTAFNGKIDEFRLWDHAKSNAEVSQLWACTLTGEEEGLLIYYQFQNFENPGDGPIIIPDLAGANDFGELIGFALSGNDSNLVNLDLELTLCAPVECNANFTNNAEMLDCGDVNFTNNSEGDNLTFSWDFGDGNSSTDESPFHNYLFPGSFQICLTVTNEDCSNEYCDDITLSFPADPPGISISVEPIIIEADPDNNCMANYNFDLPDIDSPCSRVAIDRTRNDGLDVSDPYPIGITIVTSVFTNDYGSSTVSQNVTVEANNECMDPCDDMPIEESFIPNPTFELVNCEPQGAADLECAESWEQATAGSSDLWSLDLLEIPSVGFGSQPPNGSSYYVGCYAQESISYAEYIGTCLNQTLLSMETYTLEAFFGTTQISPGGEGGGAFEGDFVILGIPICPNWPISGSDCKEDDYDVISRLTLSIPNNTWLNDKIQFEINTTETYEAIMIGVSCDPWPVTDKKNYLLIDDLLLRPGPPCDDGMTATDPCDQIPIEESFIPNADFESTSCEPNGIAQLDCANDWAQATAGSSDFFSVVAPYMTISSIGTALPPPDGSDYFVGAYARESTNWAEYIGACLTETLPANETFTLEAYFGTPDGGTTGGGNFNGDFVILGIPNCPDWPLSGSDCKEEEYDVISRKTLNLPGGVWQQSKIEFEIKTLDEYEAIMMGVSCNPWPVEDKLNYLLIDDLLLRPGPICNDCFTVEEQIIECNEDLTYDVQIKIKNQTPDQIFDRLLIFGSSGNALISPTVQTNFGVDANGAPIDTLDVDFVSGYIPFTISALDYVQEEIEVCFEVAPQNPEGGFCCAENQAFCVTLPVCCLPEETTLTEFIPDEELECCYELNMSNECAIDYFKRIDIHSTLEGTTLTGSVSENMWSIAQPEAQTISLSFNSTADSDVDNLPIGTYNPVTICLDNLSIGDPEMQEITVDWISCDDDGTEIIYQSDQHFFECEPPSDPCFEIINIDQDCDENLNPVLTITLQNLNEAGITAQDIVTAPAGNNTVDQYSPQSLHNLNLNSEGLLDFQITLNGLTEGEVFSFNITLHDYTNELEDGGFWCCSDGLDYQVLLASCASNPNSAFPAPKLEFDTNPNPVHDELEIVFKEIEFLEQIDINIFDINGKSVFSQKALKHERQVQLSTNELSTGLYFIQIQTLRGASEIQSFLKI